MKLNQALQILLFLATGWTSVTAHAQTLTEVGGDSSVADNGSFDPDSSTGPLPGMPGEPGRSRGPNCGPVDPGCAQLISRALQRFPQVLPFSVGGGVGFRNGNPQGVFEFRTTVARIDIRSGDLSVLPFEMTVQSGEDGRPAGVRFRFALANTSVVYFCPVDGRVLPPLVGGLLNTRCQRQFAGLGADVLHAQIDTETGRNVVRWIEANAVFNILNNGNMIQSLTHRLLAFAGVSADTAFYGNTATYNPAIPADSSRTAFRGNIGIMGVFRPVLGNGAVDGRFELRAMATFRPNLLDLNDHAAEVSLQAFARWAFTQHLLGEVSLLGNYSHWSRPENCFGNYCSDVSPHSGYFGATFGLNFF
jgi:hypothetical protein